MRRSSDGSLLHPSHSQFHLLRLLVGSAIGGWSIMLSFVALGFPGTIDFVDSVNLALKWVLIGGTILGIALGIPLAIIAALLVNIIPPLKRSIHPLSLVRAGFLILISSPLVALSGWPTTSWGFVLAPVVAILIAWAGVKANPHSDLVPHSTVGRGIGTAIGPAMLLAFVLAILIPMFHRGYGTPVAPRMIVVAVDGIDGPYATQLLHSNDSGRYPNLLRMEESGGYGMPGSDQPIVAARLWGGIMTGVGAGESGILDRNSMSEDLIAPTLWEILSQHNYRIGLFQAPPPHKFEVDASFDVPIPGSVEGSDDVVALFLQDLRSIGRSPGIPAPWTVGFAACALVRLGVRLETIAAIADECLWEIVMRPSPRLIYERRKLLEFRIDCDRSLALVRKYSVDVAILRFDSLESIFTDYWRYSRPNEFSEPPEDVDASLACGLGRVIPDAYRALDGFLGDLGPFTDSGSVLAVVSNHGIRSASDHRYRALQLSPARFVRAAGWSEMVLADTSSNGICLRPISIESDLQSLSELEEMISRAQWTPADERDISRRGDGTLFSTTWLEDCIEVSIQPSMELTADAVVTMDGWTGPLSEILIPGEPKSGIISGNALFLVTGPQFRRGEAARNPQVYDVAPTLLYAMGIPISEELKGRVLDELFDQVWKNEHPVEYVPEYVGSFQESGAPPESVEESVYAEEPMEVSVAEPEPVESP